MKNTQDILFSENDRLKHSRSIMILFLLNRKKNKANRRGDAGFTGLLPFCLPRILKIPQDTNTSVVLEMLSAVVN